MMAKSKGRFWFDWHSLVGVWCGLLLFLICWSGSFATLSREIDWLLNPMLRATQPPVAVLTSDYARVAQQHFPDWQLQNASQPLTAGFSAEVWMTTDTEQTRRIYIEPGTLTVLGSTSYLNVQRFFRSLHMGLFHWHGVGAYLVLLLTVPLLWMTLSACWLYRGWWRKAFTLNLRGNRRQNTASLHKLTGVWSLLFALLIGLTCVWYLVEALRYDIGDGIISRLGMDGQTSQIVVPSPQFLIEQNSALPISPQQAELSVAAQFPQLQIVNFRAEPGMYYFDGQTADWWLRDRANKVYVNALDGQVLASQFQTDLDLYWTLSDMADPLHFGNFAGLPVKVVWAVLGLGLSFLCLSGSYMFVSRRAQSRKSDPRYAIYTVIGSSSIAILLTIWFGIEELASYLDPAHLLTHDVHFGVMIFLVCWIALTLVLLAYWIKCLVAVGR